MAIIPIIETITQASLSRINDKIAKGDEVLISSYGGDVYAGLGAYSILKTAGIDTRAVGVVASAATLFLLAGENRRADKTSEFLLHFITSTVTGTAEDMASAALDIEKTNNSLIDIYLEKLNITRDELVSLMNENKFITAEYALKINLITEITDMKKNLINSFKESLAKMGLIVSEKTNVLNITDVTGSKFIFPDIETSSQIVVGTKVTDEGGLPFDGIVTTSIDGVVTIIHCVGGLITEIENEQTEPMQMDALTKIFKEAFETMTKKYESVISELKNEIKDVNSKLNSVTEDCTSLQGEFKSKFKTNDVTHLLGGEDKSKSKLKKEVGKNGSVTWSTE